MSNSVHKSWSFVRRRTAFNGRVANPRIHSLFFQSQSAARLSGVLESPTVERAGEFLGRVAQRLGKPEAAIAWLGAAWPSIVGGALAAHTRPIRCENGCLTIVADGKPWHRQLEGLKQEICSGVNRTWGRTLVREVVLIASKTELNSVSRELDNEYTPFIRKRT